VSLICVIPHSRTLTLPRAPILDRHEPIAQSLDEKNLSLTWSSSAHVLPVVVVQCDVKLSGVLGPVLVTVSYQVGLEHKCQMAKQVYEICCGPSSDRGNNSKKG